MKHGWEGSRYRSRAFRNGRTVAFVLAACLAACREQSPATILAPELPGLAKSGGGGGPTVTSTSPAYAHRDTTLDVRVLGNGFSSGATASWSLGGDTTQVHVNSTTYVSNGELRANVTVPAGAPLALYDVVVTLAGGKKGVGSEMFEVTTAEPFYAIDRVTEMNDIGGIVGGTTTGIYYEDACGGVNLGSASVWGLDPLGTMVTGRGVRTDDLLAVVWIRTGSCSFTRERLPNPDRGGGSGKSIARTPAGVIIVGGIDAKANKPTGAVSAARPALWTRSGSSWLGPVLYATPTGQGEIWRINGQGRAVGRYSPVTGQTGVLWNDATDYTVIDGLPFGLNEAGTIAVGHNNAGFDAYWTRNPTTGRWDVVGTVLPGLTGPAGGTAFDVNDAGIIVGRFADGSKTRAAAWRLDLSAYPPVLVGVEVLPGIGPSSSPADALGAKAITNVLVDGFYVVAGNASGPSGASAVRWRIMP